ncbi:MAG: hypothetical protein H0W75_08385 [Chitinophagaceae bacterium]|nr:hypothetical protein [Chitinophagaceae bacterium]
MDDIKNKMYNYETTPPAGVWETIAAELDADQGKVIPIIKRSNKTLYYLAAAAVAIILFCLVFFTTQFSKSTDEKLITSSENKGDTLNNNVLITVPTDEKNTVKNNNESQNQNISKKNRPDKKQNKVAIENKKSTEDNQLTSNSSSRYITIEGLQGQPVKVSSKMATLIDSSETKTASKPIWNKKINEWREIMKVNTLAPTTSNFLDIIELTKTLKDKK